MSDTPTSDQLDDIRNTIGDTTTPPTFDDTELERIWYLVRGATDETEQTRAAIAMSIERLMGNSVKLVNHRAGQISENRGDIIKNLERIYKLYENSLKSALGTSRQFAMTKLRSKPRQNRTEPGESADRRPPSWREY